jgi:ribose transport system ATP-binding protein
MPASDSDVRDGEPRLAIAGLSKSFAGGRALHDVDLDLYAGECHALAGQNGAGKSTLIRILAGVQRPDAGTMSLDGKPLDLRAPIDAHRAGIFTIYQELSLVPALSVAENIFLGDLPRRVRGGIDWARARREAREDLAQLGFAFDVTKPVGALSLAQRQVVEIAKVLRRQAKVVLLDEPSATLSPQDTHQLFDVLRTLRRRGITLLYISHRLEELYEVCERVTILRDGEKVGTYPLGELPRASLVARMVGAPEGRAPSLAFGDGGATPAASPSAITADAALSVHGLSDGGALRNVDLVLRRGEVLGVTGLVGSGQTELGQCLFGARPIVSGSVEVDGRRVAVDSPRRAIEAGIGLVPEERKTQGLVLGMSVAQNLTLASLNRVCRRAVVQRGQERAVALQMQRRLQIKISDVDQPVGTLSGGNQQKVVLGKWLLSGARILVLAEPTRGVDVHAKAEIWQIVRQLASDGVSVLVLTCEIEEAAMCDRAVVLADGRVAGEADGADPEVAYQAIVQLCG